MIEGDYKVLENGEQDIICLARFDESDIVIGVINPNSDSKKVVFSLSDVVKDWLNSSHINCANYTQDVLLLRKDDKDWHCESFGHIPVEKLLREGLYVEIDSKSCQIIRLRIDYMTKQVSNIHEIGSSICFNRTRAVTTPSTS